jgi:AcrR family transcriptional regulator
LAKSVDHEERRRELAEAALRVVRDRGLDGLTIRAVAAESGWSPGAMAHYFDSKDALLQTAHQRVIERIFERVLAADSAGSPMARLREAIMAALPINADLYAEMTVWYAFLGRALARKDFGDQQRAGHREWIAELERHLEDARTAGEIPRATDVRAAALDLSFAVDGIALQGTLFNREEMTPKRQLELLDEHLDRLRARQRPRPRARTRTRARA